MKSDRVQVQRWSGTQDTGLQIQHDFHPPPMQPACSVDSVGEICEDLTYQPVLIFGPSTSMGDR